MVLKKICELRFSLARPIRVRGCWNPSGADSGCFGEEESLVGTSVRHSKKSFEAGKEVELAPQDHKYIGKDDLEDDKNPSSIITLSEISRLWKEYGIPN
ncbi:hypothetical protein L484_027859 [Morus notabilis]|uniref:Uncharacterized protein n=1 Tax=Morus notabilis TaxID=981085 RepID=W9SHT2_9ROSA|nr:hypothetical protein L484_027859 [Morus notabilis]